MGKEFARRARKPSRDLNITDLRRPMFPACLVEETKEQLQNPTHLFDIGWATANVGLGIARAPPTAATNEVPC